MTVLSKEQEKVYNLWTKGRENIFISGPGGSGKTRLIQYIYEKNNISLQRKLQVCAMTGCASVLLNCNAVTIHSWSGIRLGKEEPDVILARIKKSYLLKQRWKKIQCLIIDEISMMSVKILELLDFIGKNIRGNEKPFGGIQLLFSGDFYQLPPIENDSFCFESHLWNKIFKKENQIEFKTIFRQKDDIFQNILNEIRVGTLTKKNEIILKRYLNRNHKEVKPAKLYPLRYKVDNMNNTLYNNLESKEYIYPMIKNINTKKYLHNNTIIPTSILEKCNRLSTEQIEKEIQNLMITNQIMNELKIKKGSIIMCTSNLDVENGICNGSQGVVEECSSTLDGPEIRFYNGKQIKLNLHYIQSDDYPIISIGYYPICYAWAMTIHKIQGTTLDCAEIDIGNNVFTYGQSYVALSRLKSLDGLYLKEISKEKITVHPKVKEFYSNLTL